MNSRIGTLVVMTSLLLGVSCVGQGTSSFDAIESDESQALNALSDPYTSLGTGDESAQFNDQEVAAVENQEEDVSDTYAPEDPAAEPAAGCNLYNLLIRWGQLTGFNAAVTNPTNWSGSISVNAGTLSVTKKVAFEFQDKVLERTDPKIINFRSVTVPHFDGLRIRYEVCDTDLAALAEGEVATLTFNSPDVPFSKSYTVDEMQDLNDLVENVDASGDRFHAQAIHKTDLCQGTLEGQWVSKTDKYGVFKGIVVASNGIRVGYVRGLFGEQSNGDQKWIAKFISDAGKFGGILEGSYADGSFTGNIHNGEKAKIGTVDGIYVGSSTEEPGTFSANYTLDCADVPSENQ